MYLQDLFGHCGKCPAKGNRPRIPNRAKTPFLGFQRRESTFVLRPDDSESRKNAVLGTSTPRIHVTVAP
eukprot:7911297-Pyramimonas_sp.AAC.1